MIWIYIKSRVLISAGMALTVYVGLKIGGIRYAGLFAIMSFLLDFIPYFGSLTAGIVITLFSLITYDVGCAVKVGTVYLDCSAVGGECGFAQSARGSNSGTSSTDSPGDSIMQCHWGPVGMLFAVPLAGMVKNIFLLMVEFLVTPSGICGNS